MKMEYLGDKSILILSTPWEQDGKEYVLELGRDVTNSFSVYDATSEDSSELRELITVTVNLRPVTVLRAFTVKAMRTICCRKCLLFRKNS